MLAVRFPAVLCGSLLLISLFVLTRQVTGRDGLALAVVAVALTMPVIAAGNLLMTIDAPYTCCWGWALVAGHRAVFHRTRWAWPVTGLLVGLGILAKYTMILWVPSLGLFLLATPGFRRTLWRPGFWVMAVMALVCCVPVIVWNAGHHWVSLNHVSGQAGLHDPAGLRWWGPAAYVVTQAALLLGFWFVAWVAALSAHRPWRKSDPGLGYLWWMSVPMFGFFLLCSLRTPVEPNWPVTAYLSGLVLTVNWVARQVRSDGMRRPLATACLAAACGLGLALTVLMHHSTWGWPILARLAGPATPDRPLPLRRFDPTCRLRGWRQELAVAVDRVCGRLREQGDEPIIAAADWTVPGELAFYCQDHPVVYSLGLALGDRHSQYDLWRPNPIKDRQAFAGKTFVFVGELHPLLRAMFRAVGPAHAITYREGGYPIARWTITICRGFRRARLAAGGRW
jgi:hypothetical protein